jgi:hypothetical protein
MKETIIETVAEYTGKAEKRIASEVLEATFSALTEWLTDNLKDTPQKVKALRLLHHTELEATAALQKYGVKVFDRQVAAGDEVIDGTFEDVTDTLPPVSEATADADILAAASEPIDAAPAGDAGDDEGGAEEKTPA